MFPHIQLDVLILKLLKTILIPMNFTIPLQFILQNADIFVFFQPSMSLTAVKHTVSFYISPECKVCTKKLSLTSVEPELTTLSSKLEAKTLFNSSSSSSQSILHIRRINNVWQKDTSAFYGLGYFSGTTWFLHSDCLRLRFFSELLNDCLIKSTVCVRKSEGDIAAMVTTISH